jgi:hypothetical protein
MSPAYVLDKFVPGGDYSCAAELFEARMARSRSFGTLGAGMKQQIR